MESLFVDYSVTLKIILHRGDSFHLQLFNLEWQSEETERAMLLAADDIHLVLNMHPKNE